MKGKYNLLGQYVSLPYWTEEAIMCYERGCVCSKDCPNYKIIGNSCTMKASVLETVKRLGVPTEKNTRKNYSIG